MRSSEWDEAGCEAGRGCRGYNTVNSIKLNMAGATHKLLAKLPERRAEQHKIKQDCVLPEIKIIDCDFYNKRRKQAKNRKADESGGNAGAENALLIALLIKRKAKRCGINRQGNYRHKNINRILN